jgi:hypothetical protein
MQLEHPNGLELALLVVFVAARAERMERASAFPAIGYVATTRMAVKKSTLLQPPNAAPTAEEAVTASFTLSSYFTKATVFLRPTTGKACRAMGHRRLFYAGWRRVVRRVCEG